MLSKNLLTNAATVVVAVMLAAGGCTRRAASGDGGAGDPSGSADLATATAGGGGDLASAAGDLGSLGTLYDSDGPEAYTQLSLMAGSVAVVVYLPATAGPRPAVVLTPGLQQPGAAYAPYARRLASWGVIAVLRDDPGVLAQPQSVADDVAAIVAWLPTPTQLAGRVDTAHVGLAGHSRGGMASLLALAGGASARAFFGLDPVDNNGAARAKLPMLTVPTAFLGETTDAAGGMACAPADQNYATLYDAAPSPSLSLTAVGADHTQFEDPASCAFCTLCTAGSADGATVRRYATRYLMSFFARELLGDTRIDATLNSAADVAGGLVVAKSK